MPRYYKYGFQGPQYAGQWSHQVPTPQTQAPGLRYGLGDEASDIVDQFSSPFSEAPPSNLSTLSDKELDILIKFTQSGLSAPGPKATKVGLAAGEILLANLRDEKSKRTRNLFIILGATGLGLYFFTRSK
jgi:hypothetical protein